MKYSLDHARSVCPEFIEDGALLWQFKHDLEGLEHIKNSDPLTYHAQMMQRPSMGDDGIFKDEYWRYYDELPDNLVDMRMYCDTASKPNEWNDFSVLQVWAKSSDNKIYLLDRVSGKWPIYELEQNVRDLYERWKPTIHKPFGLTKLRIEDASSGVQLIQILRNNGDIPVDPIPVRKCSKVEAAYNSVKYFASGMIYIPKVSSYNSVYKAQFRDFMPDDSHMHDDDVDATLYAIEDMLVFNCTVYNEYSLG